MPARPLTAAAWIAATLALALVGCNGDDEPAQQPDGDSVTVYSSLPLGGAQQRQAAAIVAGIEQALAERSGKAGELDVEYRSLDNTEPGDAFPTPAREAGNARTAVQDEASVAYIGGLSFGDTAISVPVLNHAGMVQVSPAATYDGLTRATPSAQRGEPEKYYPTEERTFARIVPIDSLQARVLAGVMTDAGCRNVFLAAHGDTSSRALAQALVTAAQGRGIELAGRIAVDPEAPDLEDIAESARDARSACAVFAGRAGPAASQVYGQLAAALPDARLFGSDGVCRGGFPPGAALPRAVGDRLVCTSVVRDLGSYPGGEDVGVDDPYALYGYEAMRLVLDAIQKGGKDRLAVRRAVLATGRRESPLGEYDLDAAGDTTLDAYGVYRVRAGRLRLERVARP